MQLQTRLPGQRRVRPDADRHQHHVRGEFALVGLYRLHHAPLADYLDDPLSTVEAHALPAKHLRDAQAEVRVYQCGQRGRLYIRHRHGDAAVGQSLHDLHAYQAAADDHSGLHASGVDCGLHSHRVRHRPQGEHAVEVNSGNGGADRGGSGRQHKLVVGEEALLTGGSVRRLHDLALSVDARGQTGRVDLDVLHVAEEVRIANNAERRADQVLVLLHHVPDEVGEAAPGHAQMLAALQHRDIELRSQPRQSCGRFRAARHASYYQDLLLAHLKIACLSEVRGKMLRCGVGYRRSVLYPPMVLQNSKFVQPCRFSRQTLTPSFLPWSTVRFRSPANVWPGGN